MGVLGIIGGLLKTKGLDFLFNMFTNSNDDDKNKQVVDLITEKTGLDISNPDILENASDEQISDIKNCVLENQTSIAEIMYKIKEKDVDNTKDARGMYRDILHHTDSKWLTYFPSIYATVITIVGLGFIFGITFMNIPTQNVRFADTILGFIMGSIISPIVGFYFGSSSMMTPIKTKSNGNGKSLSPIHYNSDEDGN